jgi:hypothetical protein
MVVDKQADKNIDFWYPPLFEEIDFNELWVLIENSLKF